MTTSPSTTSRSLLTVNTEPDDDEDYLSTLARQLYQGRQQHRAARARERAARKAIQTVLDKAAGQTAAAHSREQELWSECEDYLLEALSWHQKQTGQSRLQCDGGVFHLQTTPAAVTVTDLTLLLAWTLRLSSGLASFSAALGRLLASQGAPAREPESASIQDGDLATPRAPLRIDAQKNEIEALVTELYRFTGLLPDGCCLMPERRTVVLE